MFKQLDNTQIEELLHNQLVGRLGCHADGQTYVVPLSYAYDGKYIYGRTFEGKKLEMLRKNPGLCFQVDDTHDLSNWRSVICWGAFQELLDEPERKKAIDILSKRNLPLRHSETMHLTPDGPFIPDYEQVEGVLFRILLNTKTGKTELNDEPYYYAT
jgi:nitroimidazol reductase NimA-like FMN-containing flavoprotein (pyridoxamine 5'-phosphate oxidase superfamily)